MEAMPAPANGQPASAIEVRRLTAADWTQLRAVRLSALAEAPYAFASTLAREQEFTDDVWRGRAGSGWTFGAWQAAMIVGLATGLPPEAAAGSCPAEAEAAWQLVGMWVAPESRGRGIADQLVEAVCELASRSGAASVTLWVTEVNDRARAFYRRLGFAPTGRRQLVRPEEPEHFEEELSRRLR
ncbi:MAG TPA: GNAT family N-acetyltransferase [Streptosporangiaceae bacterium]|nr:GNAT family N-acetyltransferase [Streptosporangiaceae bacterium]